MHAHSVVSDITWTTTVVVRTIQSYTTTALVPREFVATDKGPNRSRDMLLYQLQNRKCNSLNELHFDNSAISLKLLRYADWDQQL